MSEVPDRDEMTVEVPEERWARPIRETIVLAAKCLDCGREIWRNVVPGPSGYRAPEPWYHPDSSTRKCVG